MASTGSHMRLAYARLAKDINYDPSKLAKLDGAIKMLEEDDHGLDANLNGVSYDDFISTLGKESEEKNKEMMANRQRVSGANRYEVVKVNNHDEARQFEKYTDWCIAWPSPQHYDEAVEYGLSNMYVALRDDFKKFPNHHDKHVEPGENAPLDDYGLSMICVCTQPDGTPNVICTRWNHSNGGNGLMDMDVPTFEKLTNLDFEKNFPPKDKEELKDGDGLSALFDKVKSCETKAEAYQLIQAIDPLADIDDPSLFGDDDTPIWEQPGVPIRLFNGSKNNILFMDTEVELDGRPKLASREWFSEMTPLESNNETFICTRANGSELLINLNGGVLAEGKRFTDEIDAVICVRDDGRKVAYDIYGYAITDPYADIFMDGPIVVTYNRGLYGWCYGEYEVFDPTFAGVKYDDENDVVVAEMSDGSIKRYDFEGSEK